MRKADRIRCWQGHEVNGTLISCWVEYESVDHFNKRFGITELKTHIPYDSANSLLGLYLVMPVNASQDMHRNVDGSIS